MWQYTRLSRILNRGCKTRHDIHSFNRRQKLSSFIDSNFLRSFFFDFFHFIRGSRFLFHHPGRNSFSQRWHRTFSFGPSLLLFDDVVVVVVVWRGVCSVGTDWLQPFPCSRASFSPAALSVHFTGFRYNCCSDSFGYCLCGVVRVRGGLVSGSQAGCPAMSLPSLGKIKCVLSYYKQRAWIGVIVRISFHVSLQG